MIFHYQGKEFFLKRRENEATVTAPNGKSYVLHKTIGEVTESVCKELAEAYLEQVAKEYAANHLLELKNKDWKDNELVSKEEFMSRVTLQETELLSDNTIKLWCNDGGMFSGHSIQVFCDEFCTPYKVNI